MKSIKLTKGLVSLVDDEDYEMLCVHSWYVVGHPQKEYAARYGGTINGKTIHIRMHRYLLNAPNHLEVDHINGNRLDNRRCNLRIATRSENGRNRRKFTTRTSSKYKGVSYHIRDHCWQACIIYKNQKFHIGSFKSELEAAKAYNGAAIKMHGAFARLNEFMEDKKCQK